MPEATGFSAVQIRDQTAVGLKDSRDRDRGRLYGLSCHEGGNRGKARRGPSKRYRTGDTSYGVQSRIGIVLRFISERHVAEQNPGEIEIGPDFTQIPVRVAIKRIEGVSTGYWRHREILKFLFRLIGMTANRGIGMDVKCMIISVRCYVELRVYQSDEIVNLTRVGGKDIRIRDSLYPQNAD